MGFTPNRVAFITKQDTKDDVTQSISQETQQDTTEKKEETEAIHYTVN